MLQERRCKATIKAMKETDGDARRDVREIPVLPSLIDNLQMALAKADLQIAKEYAGMIADQTIRRPYFHADRRGVLN